MRIAVVDPACLTWPYTPLFCQALVQKGCQVDLIGSQYPFPDEREPIGARTWYHFYRLSVRVYGSGARGPARQALRGAEHVAGMIRLGRLVRSLHPDVIHYQQAPLPWVDQWFVTRLQRIAPVVSTVHNTEPFHGEASRFQKAGFAGLLTRFTHLIVHTEYSRRHLREKVGVTDHRISVFSHPLFEHYRDVAEPMPSPSNPGVVKPGEAVVLFFGNISRYKGLDVLIRAFGRLPETVLNRTRLLVAGVPKIPIREIRDLAVAQGVDDRIIWQLGRTDTKRVDAVFRRATVIALPYRHIDGSGAFCTALCYGKPFIASRVGVFGEALEDGVHGCLVEPGDHAALADRLAWMLSDRDRLAKMGEAVERLRDSWPSWDALAKHTLAVYRTVVRR